MIDEQLVDKIVCADVMDYLRSLPDNSVNCCVTSPPYFGLRDYGVEGQIGLEPTPKEFVATMVAVFGEVRRVLRDDGTCWINLGDSYAGSGNYRGVKQDATLSKKQRSNGGARGLSQALGNQVPDGYKAKDLMMIPARVAIALCDDGWYLRSEIVWHKPNPMPESVRDRPTKSHEMVYLLTKKAKYWYDADAIREAHKAESLTRYEYGLNTRAPADGYVNVGANNPRAMGHAKQLKDNINIAGRNARSVWTVSTEPTPHAHFATFPRKLITPMILAGCPVDGIVLDPFMGAGTTALVARSLQRHYMGCDLNSEYVKMANGRLDAPYTIPLPMDKVVDIQLPMFQGDLLGEVHE